MHDAARTFVNSTDLLYAVSNDLYTCGYVAAVHAVSDVFAVLADPAWATLTIGLPHREVARGGLASTLAGAADALFADGVVLAGGHSVYSSDVFVGVAVSGLARHNWHKSEPEPGDSLILSKPLGSGIVLTSLKLGLIDEREVEDEFSLLKESNRSTSRLLREINESKPGSVRAVTDVSGFGFLQATALVSGNTKVVIDASGIPTIQRARRLLDTGAISPLADKNMISSEDSTRFELLSDRDTAFLRMMLNDPQTSGGLLAVLSPEGTLALSKATASSSRPPSIVGTYGSWIGRPQDPVNIVIRGNPLSARPPG
jgi:selenide,water dikinase